MNQTVSKGLVHICGFPSSGTDLLSNFMSSHPDICVRGEFPMLPKLAERFGPEIPASRVQEAVDALRKGDVYGNWMVPDPQFSDLGENGTMALADIYSAMITDRDVRWRGNKTPQNTENMDKLVALFPDTRFVFIVRDIRDVCVSWRRKWGKDMYLCAAKWNRRMQKGLEIAERLSSDRILFLQFEDLITDPAGTGGRICAFLDLPFDDDTFINYHRNVDNNPDGKKNFGKPIQSKNRGKWRNALTEQETRRIEEIAYPTMEKLGYTPEIAKGFRPISMTESLRGLTVDVMSALAVGNRYRKKNRLRDRLRKLGISIRYRMPGH